MEITTMNNYLDKVFDTPNKKAFIAFLTAGDPDADSTVKFILEMEKAGADLIEIGIPFSDPTAEGVVIQEANIFYALHFTRTVIVADNRAHTLNNAVGRQI